MLRLKMGKLSLFPLSLLHKSLHFVCMPHQEGEKWNEAVSLGSHHFRAEHSIVVV